MFKIEQSHITYQKMMREIRHFNLIDDCFNLLFV